MAFRSGRRPPATVPCGRRIKSVESVDPGIKSGETASRPHDQDEILLRAARLGITPERVLQEYARIAFADLRRIADWGPDGFVLKNCESLSDGDVAAVSEVASSGRSKNCRIKLYDKKSALDVIARHLGMFAQAAHRPAHGADAAAEDAREVLARRLARLAAGSSER
ncbi:MAG: terminase small subunit [Stellaceae bacterium]